MFYKKSELVFDPTLNSFYAERQKASLTVLSGANNSGKSLTLKWLKAALGKKAYMIGPVRFYHVHQFSSAVINPNELDDFENQFQANFAQDEVNHEQNFFDLNRIIGNLTDTKRSILFELCGELIGTTFKLKKLDEENELSVRYIDMDGQNLSVGSTGTRLLMTMLGICMDERFKIIMIDEPELGLSPRVQEAFSNFLQDEKERKKYFPHLDNIFISTHSHLFLDRKDVKNNFVVSKQDKAINIFQVNSINEFHKLQFNMLGNTLESLFLPSAIIVVEGKTDFAYIDRLIQIKYPTRKIIVLSGQGDIKKRISGIRDTFGNLSKSPFGERLFAVVDSVHQASLTEELVKMGMNKSNIAIWNKNGIEYLYPEEIMTDIFGCSKESLVSLDIKDDLVTVENISYKKNELCDEVIKRLDSSTKINEEINNKLLKPLEIAIS